MRHYLGIACVLLLVGCCPKPLVVPSPGLDTKPTDGTKVEQPKQTVDVDKELLKLCKTPQKMENKNPSPEDVLDQQGKQMLEPASCARRHNKLVELVKKAFNISD